MGLGGSVIAEDIDAKMFALEINSHNGNKKINPLFYVEVLAHLMLFPLQIKPATPTEEFNSQTTVKGASHLHQ